MSSRANRRARRAGLVPPARKALDCTPLSRSKVLHGRDSTNWVTPTEVDVQAFTQARPAGTKIAYGWWTDPDWAMPDVEVPYITLAGVRVNNNSRCQDVRPASETPKPSSNRVQDYSRQPVLHASKQANRLSYGDMLQHGIMQEKE